VVVGRVGAYYPEEARNLHGSDALPRHMAHALEEAWAVLKYDYEDDYYSDDDADEFMSLDSEEEELTDEEIEERKRALEQMAYQPDPLELPTIGRELDDVAGSQQEQGVREQWGDDLGELRSEGHKRDYSHLDPNEAGWHREMDRRASNIAAAYMPYLTELYERHKRAVEEGNTQIANDAISEMNKQGGRLRIGELLGDEEAIEELKQFDLSSAARDMGFGGDDEEVMDVDDEPDKPPRSRKEMNLDEQMLQSGPVGVTSQRRYTGGRGVREDRGYETRQVRVKPASRSAWLGGADRAARSDKSGRIIIGDKESEADLSRQGRLAYINAHRKYAKLHEQRANSEGAWAYQRPETHPDFEGELPPPGSVVVRNRPTHRGGQRDPKSEKVAIPASTYKKPHPSLVDNEEEE
jgi:hypothetical protein